MAVIKSCAKMPRSLHVSKMRAGFCLAPPTFPKLVFGLSATTTSTEQPAIRLISSAPVAEVRAERVPSSPPALHLLELVATSADRFEFLRPSAESLATKLPKD